MAIISFILGLVFGSFANVIATRLVGGRSIIFPRSSCDSCGKCLLPKDMVPIVSFLILKGRCRFCRKKISLEHPIVEFILGFLFLISYLGLGFGWQMVAYWISSVILVILFMSDLKGMVLPDIITIPSIIILFLVDILILHASLFYLLISIIIGGGFFIAQYLVSHGSWIGSGDIRFGILMAVILIDPKKVVLALMISYVIGSVISLLLLAMRRKNLKSEVPLGVFLTIGTFLVMFLFR